MVIPQDQNVNNHGVQDKDKTDHFSLVMSSMSSLVCLVLVAFAVGPGVDAEI